MKTKKGKLSKVMYSLKVIIISILKLLIFILVGLLQFIYLIIKFVDKYLILKLFPKGLRKNVSFRKRHVLLRTLLPIIMVSILVGVSLFTGLSYVNDKVEYAKAVEKELSKSENSLAEEGINLIKTDGEVKESEKTKEIKGKKENKSLSNEDVWSGKYADKDIRNLKDKVYTEQELYLLRDIQGHDVMFIASIIPFAKEIAHKNGLYASIMVAQACLESDWGRSKLTLEGNNLFGVKAKKGQESVTMPTNEDDGNGNLYQIDDAFAVYDTYKGSFEANAELLKTGNGGREDFYYRGAWVENTDSYKDATEWLTGRYATDTSYNNKLNELIERYNLSNLDK